MTRTTTWLDWDTVHAQERAAIREPDDRCDGPDRPMTGLAFSGGGIRSATFNLGIAQALAELHLLRRFDYLSCVSGGGYIGGWLSAFIRTKCGRRVEAAEDKLKTGGEEISAIRFLRSYSNYLTPKASFFSADTLTAVATYLRNLYLNLTLLLLFLGGVLLLPRLLVGSIRWLTEWESMRAGAEATSALLFAGGIGCIFLAMVFAGLNLGSRGAFDSRPFYTRQNGVLLLVVAPVLLSAWLIAYAFYVDAAYLATLPLPVWMLWGIAAYVPPWFIGWGLGRYLGRNKPGRMYFSAGRVFEMALYALLAGALGGVLLAAFAEIVRLIPCGYSGSWIVSALGTALLLKVYSLTVVGHIGLMGRYFSHESLEWWARLGGWVLLAALVWALLFSLVFLAPAFFDWAHQAVIAAGGVTWAASTAMGVLLGRGAKTAGATGSNWRDYAAQVAPYIFVVGLLGLLSLGLHALLMLPVFCRGCEPAVAPADFMSTLYQEALNFQKIDTLRVAALCAGSFLAAAALAARIDVNLFSIYHFYRQRLVRCFLGASRCEARAPHPLTGFDPRDDIRLAEYVRASEGRLEFQRPYLIHNTAMNLVSGKQLAWQERRAAAFAFTPFASGYSFRLPDEKGMTISRYRPTSLYMEGVWAGSAMAISGAAACPNMGYHSSPALTFLMTVFNVRLGHWSPNPANEVNWTKHDPAFGGTYLLKELFGKTGYDSPFVYLSDGGHFENLGIYELVRRRCACIVAVDAGADTSENFDDLGNAIRKCYADFGVVIEIHAEDLTNGYAAVGRITYTDAPPATLIYIKPRLIGTEPADLLNYKRTHPGFPHDTTADQWFDESQFESYRKLGHWIGLAVLDGPLKAIITCPRAPDAGAHEPTPGRTGENGDEPRSPPA
ncbi:MAG: hypothetical protein ACLGHA_01045 [Gammaproteobacteria bacterium]